MIRIGICGKAGTGKDTAAKYILKKYKNIKQVAFADPIKKIAETMYPNIDKKWLYGPSQFRNSIIKNAFKNNEPLSVRQLLIDIGTAGRAYNENIWIESVFNNINLTSDSFIFSDIRFINEFNYLKKNNFKTIKIKRIKNNSPNSETETQLDLIPEDEFSCIIDNDYDIKHLYEKIDDFLMI
jgi:dephospho-CoA kinase